MNRASSLIIALFILMVGNSNVCAVILYGTARSGYYDDGNIYEIDTKEHKITLLVNINKATLSPSWAPLIPVASDSPNGNAFDTQNNRFYFASFCDPGQPVDISVPSSQLYFVDLDDPNVVVWAGSLIGHASDGTLYDGQYWYIGHGTNILRVVSLKSDGTIDKEKGASVIWMIDPNSGQFYAPLWSFGDIAFDKKGLLYITGSISDEFGRNIRSLSGTYEIEKAKFTEIGNSIYWGQIAFANDGRLYGHDAETGDFYTINTTDGTTKYEFTEAMFTDIAAPPPGRKFLPEDFEADGNVDFVDFALFAIGWSGRLNIETINSNWADLNNDKEVDMYDMLMFMDNWLEIQN
jgi:hypothetical protein